MDQQARSGGCLKVLAIVLPILGLTGFLLHKVSQAQGRAAAVSARVVGPYLEKVRAGQYQQALDAHGSPGFRQRVSAAELAGAYETLSQRHGRFVSSKLFVAEEQHAIGSGSIVRAKYTLTFERAEEHVAYDISGDGDGARIDEAYERPVGPDMLRAAPR